MGKIDYLSILLQKIPVTQGKKPLLFPLWQIVGFFLLISICFLLYWFILYIWNKKRGKVYIVQVKLPIVEKGEEEEAIDKMRSLFASIHNITRSQTDRLFLEIIKSGKYIIIQAGSNNEKLLTKVITICRQEEGITFIPAKEDAIVAIAPLHTRFVTNTKDYYPITHEKYFFDNLLSYLASLSDNEQAGIQIILRGVNKNLQIQELQRNLTQKAVMQKRRQTNRETYLLHLYQKKQQGNMFKMRLNIFANTPVLLTNLTAIIQSLNFEENIFFSLATRKENILHRFIAPDTFLSLIHEIRKHEGMYLNAEEVAYLFHPTAIQLGKYAPKQTRTITASPDFIQESENNIHIGRAEERDVYFPLTNFARHIYLIGKTGRGKSTLLVTIIKELVEKKHPTIFVIDPHTELLTQTIYTCKDSKDIVYLNIHKQDRVFTFNPLFAFQKTAQQKAVIKDMLLDIIQHETEEVTGGNVYGTATYNRMDDMITLGIEFADAYYYFLRVHKKISEQKAREQVYEKQLTLNDLPFLLEKKLEYFTLIKAIFSYYPNATTQTIIKVIDEQAKYQPAVTEAVHVRFKQLLKSSTHLIFEGNKFNIEEALASGKTFLFPIPDIVYGTHGARALTQMLFSLLWMYKREKETDRKETYVFIDEFQKAQIKDIPEIIAEGRKYKLFLTLSNQQLGQLRENIKNAILGNVGTLISFTVGADAIGGGILTKQFAGVVSEKELVSLPPFNAYIKTEGMQEKPVVVFSFSTIPLVKHEQRQERIAEINTASLQQYGESIQEVEERLQKKRNSAIDYFTEAIDT
jgi:hypothetical protein